jgi:hypothetical protein
LLIEIGTASLVLFLVVAPALRFAREYSGLREDRYDSGFWGAPALTRRLALGAGFVAVWSLYWVMLWPGTITVDSFRQIIQALHLVPYSDHHPIAHTLAIEFLLNPLVSMTGDINFSLSIITGVQLVALSIVFTLCIDGMRAFNLPGWVLTATYVLFLIHPLTGWYSVALWKDIWLSAFVLILGTVSATILYRIRRGETLSWKYWALFTASIIAVAFAKKTGLIVVVPLVLGIAIYLRGRDLFRWVGFGISAIMLYLAGHALIVLALDVRPGSEVEAWSLPVQQIARTAKLDAETLSDAERATIAKFFNDADLGKRYEPGSSDPIKGVLSEDLMKTNRSEFIDLWIRLGKEHPITYVDATLNQTLGYWYPDVTYWMVSASSWSDILRFTAADKRRDTVEKRIAISLYKDLNGGVTTAVVPYTPELYPLNSIRRIPIIGWFLSLGAWVWSAILLCAVSVVRRNPQTRSVGILMSAVWVTCLLSPVFAEARYAYPIFLLLPLLGSLAFMRPSKPEIALQLKSKTRMKETNGAKA